MRNTVYLIGRIFLVLGVILLTAVALDELLLKSDLRSLSLLSAVLLGAAAVAAMILGGGVSLALNLAGRRSWTGRLATVAPVAASVGGAVAIFSQPVLRKFDLGWALPWVWVGAGLIYYLITRRKSDTGVALSRAGVGALLLALVMAPTAVGLNAARSNHGTGSASDGKSGLLLIIVDALGAEYISGLSDQSPVQTPGIDAFLARSTVFPNAHTNAPNTNGAFRALYSGKVLQEPGQPTPSLVGSLQDSGVNVRIVASHMNAFPDSKQIRYKGLRSLLLTQNYSWLPAWAGLDYHLMTYLNAARVETVKGMKADRLQVMRDLLNSGYPVTDPFDVARAEIDRLVKDDRPFLLVLHLFFNDTHATLPKPATIDLYPERTAQERAATNRSIREHSYRYTDEEAWWAAEYHAAYVDGVRDFDHALGEFVESLSSAGRFENMGLILMADHGSSSQDNELWYAYHSSESSTRIPLVIYEDDTQPSRNLRPSSTVDVSATIRDWFGIDNPGDGRSLLDDLPDAAALCFIRRDHEGIARAISYSRDRKDVFEIDTDHKATWVESYAIADDGSVTNRAVTPPDPSALAAKIEEYCETHDCP